MSNIAKAKPINARSSTADLSAADETVHATFSGGDEETGDGLVDPATANVSALSASPNANAQRPQQSRSRYFLAGALVVIVLAVAIGMGSRSNGEDSAAPNTAVAVPNPPVDETNATVTAQGFPDPNEPGSIFLDIDGALDVGIEQPIATIEETAATNNPEPVIEESTMEAAAQADHESSTPGIVIGADEFVSVSSDDVGGDTATAFKPELEVNVGDSALLNPNVPTETAVATSEAAVIASPTMNPTPAPSTSPSNEPTPTPTASPSRKPTLEPTTSEPTKSPTPKPTVLQLNLSGWQSFNWSGETPAPSASPSVSPTPEPTKAPVTAVPTSAPSNNPSALPSTEPTGSPSQSPTTANPTESPTPNNPYFMGDEFYTFTEDGVTLDVSKGLTVRLLAKTGSKVQFANGDESKKAWHTRTDAAGIVSMNPEDPLNSGYAYLSNSEEGDGGGGVHGLYFDQYGNVVDYRTLLSGTTDNCGGGLTPWNTWITCEEYSDGQCWQVDGVSGKAKETVLGGKGGRYESVAVDNRNPENPIFFTTEDDEEGALRRFVARGSGWDAVHSDGDHSFLNILGDGTFEWTEDIDEGRASARKNFPNSEGVQVHEGKVYFMSKVKRKLLVLDLETYTYETETTGKKFYGEGDYGDQPDQNLFGPTRKYMYFTEDGGKNPGVFARYGTDGTYFTMFQGDLDEEDETVGIALSPNHKIFYAALQDHGMVYAFEREDGEPFE